MLTEQIRNIKLDAWLWRSVRAELLKGPNMTSDETKVDVAGIEEIHYFALQIAYDAMIVRERLNMLRADDVVNLRAMYKELLPRMTALREFATWATRSDSDNTFEQEF